LRWLQNIFYRMIMILLVLPIGVACAATSAANLPVNLLQAPEWPVAVTSFGGHLLLSDSPETVPADGIMYQDTVNGSARLFFHHVNGTAVPKKIVAVLVNEGSEAANVTVSQYGVAGPSADYMAVGKAAQQEYLSAPELYLLAVPPHGVALLAPVLDVTVVSPNMLVNGIYDFQTDKPLTVKMMMLPVTADVEKAAATATVLPSDMYRLRGTFDGPDRLLVPEKAYDPKQDGVLALTLADNQVDRYQRGIDATDGSAVINYGNYGVVYKLYIPSAFGSDLQVFLNPRGGDFAGALGVKYKYQVEAPLPVPLNAASFGSKVSDLSKVGTFASGQSLWLTFSPPGASNLPVRLIFAPR
jgi:hypothetical protein